MRLSSTVVFVLLLGASASGQRAPALRLKPPVGTRAVDVSGAAMIRELADGRVIILDSTEKKLFLADLRSGRSSQVGRVGDGPQEYRMPMGLFPLAGDSTLVTDARIRRWILFAGATPVVTIPPKSPGMGAPDGFVRGADANGWVSVVFPPTNLGRARDQGDSFYLARFSRRTGRGDTLARLRSGFGGPPGSATKSTPQAERAYVPGPAREFMLAPVICDQAVGFPDGWIAVARVAPYRVDWIDPDGKLHRGQPLPVPVTPLDEREQRFYLTRQSERDGKPAGEPRDIKDWIPAIPPFWGHYDSALFTAPGGELVIARAATLALPNPTYDVVTRIGTYRGQLVLRPGERIIGFGRSSVYVSTIDPDGTERLQRHPWP